MSNFAGLLESGAEAKSWPILRRVTDLMMDDRSDVLAASYEYCSEDLMTATECINKPPETDETLPKLVEGRRRTSCPEINVSYE
jgi:hypothetical protein